MVARVDPSKFRGSNIGALPADWDVKPLGEIGEPVIGLTYEPKNVKSHGVLVLRSSNIGDGRLVFDDNVFVDVAISEKLRARKNDLLICVRNGSRPLIGKSALIDDRAVGMTFGAFMSVFRSPFNEFVFQCFQSDLLKRQIQTNLGATINQITNATLKSFRIPFPDVTEQRAIVDALSDVDESIDAVGRLIDKKRALKQGAAQQLLGGGVRLRGFSDEWSEIKFSDIATPRRERIDPRRMKVPDFCVELEDIQSNSGRLIGGGLVTRESSLKSVFESGDVLFGKLRAYLRKYWLADRSGICSTELWVLRPNRALVKPEYLRQLVATESFIQTAGAAYGTHMPRSDWEVVRRHKLMLPSLKEQHAISQILTDIDAEITALEREREKLPRVKTAMLQALLSGRVRLMN